MSCFSVLFFFTWEKSWNTCCNGTVDEKDQLVFFCLKKKKKSDPKGRSFGEGVISMKLESCLWKGGIKKRVIPHEDCAVLIVLAWT